MHDGLSITELLEQADRELAAGRLIKAAAWAREALARADAVPNPSDSPESRVEALVHASQVLRDADEDAAAILACRRALELIPAHAHASYNAARSLKHLGRIAQAESLLDESLARHPDNVDLLRLKADILTARDAHAEAVRLLREVVQRVPQDKVAWFNLSNSLLHLCQYAEALEPAERAIALASPPQVADAWVNKARALEGLGEDRGAIEAFTEALRSNRAQLQAHYGLARLYKRHGQRVRAGRESLYGQLLHKLYRARFHAASQLHREDLRLLDAGSDSAGASPPQRR